MQSRPCCRGPAAARRAHPHSPGRPRRPGRMQSASTGSTATRHATPDSSLGRGVDKQGLDSPSTAGQRLRTEPVERRQTPGRLHRTRPLDESETAARAASRAARQPGLKRERGDPKGRGEQLFGFTHNPQHLIVDSAASRGRGGSRARQREHRSVSAQPRALGAWPRQRPPCTLPASTHICALMSRLEGVINLPPPTVPRSRKRRGCSPITHWGDLRTSSGHQVGFSGMRGGL